MNAARPLALALASMALAACGAGDPTPSPRAAPPPRLVILYAPCTVAKTHLSPYAPGVSYTPDLEHFARESVVFTRHQTESGSSGIAYASIFTGRQADGHGVYRHPSRLRDDLQLVFEAFAEAGYETFFWNDHPMANRELGYAQGVRPANAPSRGLLASQRRFQEILARLARDPDYRAFVATNFFVSHAPYAAQGLPELEREHPAAFAGLGRTERARYVKLYHENVYGLSWNLPAFAARLQLDPEELAKLAQTIELLYASNISELDRRFGDLVRAVDGAGLKEESLIAFTADHGEVMGRETAVFQWSHSMQLAAEVLGVPLIVRAPGRLEPGRYDGVTRSIDVFPTLAGLAGFRVGDDAGIEGVDLAPALLGRELPPELRAASHTTVLPRPVVEQMSDPERIDVWSRAHRLFPDEDVGWIWVALRDGDHLYKSRRADGERWAVEAVDVSGPGERPIALGDPAWGDRLAAYKEKLVKAHAGGSARAGGEPLSGSFEAERLRSLGYIQ